MVLKNHFTKLLVLSNIKTIYSRYYILKPYNSNIALILFQKKGCRLIEKPGLSMPLYVRE